MKTKKKKKRPSTGDEVTNKSGITQVTRQIKSMLLDKSRSWQIALESGVKEIKAFAEYVRKDREAIELACTTKFSNALLEGTVNKAKAIKRSMFNRANADILRAKLIYGNWKGYWNHHLN